MEDHYRSLSHTKWQCKIHAIFFPKCRRKRPFGVVRKELGGVFHRLAAQKECTIEEGHVMPDHVHMLISVPPKHAVPSVVGYIKGKSAIHVARRFLKKLRNYAGQHLWARYRNDQKLYSESREGGRANRSARNALRRREPNRQQLT